MMVTVAIMTLMIAEPELLYYITAAQIKHKKISSAWREERGEKWTPDLFFSRKRPIMQRNEQKYGEIGICVSDDRWKAFDTQMIDGSSERKLIFKIWTKNEVRQLGRDLRLVKSVAAVIDGNYLSILHFYIAMYCNTSCNRIGSNWKVDPIHKSIKAPTQVVTLHQAGAELACIKKLCTCICLFFYVFVFLRSPLNCNLTPRKNRADLCP